jgi:acetyl-CoA decarbonylase/synthase complex subunit beta
MQNHFRAAVEIGIQVPVTMKDVRDAVIKGNKLIKEKISRMQGDFFYEETAYHLPVSYALTGKPVHSAEEGRAVYEATGENPLVGTELIIASRGMQGLGGKSPYTGFIPDAVLRKLGYSLVDGSILGLALVIGTPGDGNGAAGACRELQEKLMLTFLAGNVVPSLMEKGVKVGTDLRLVPLGPDPLQAVHFVDIIARVAMMFGGVAPGDADRLIAYARERAKAFVIVFPGLSDEEIAFVDALKALSIPLVTPGDYEGEGWIRVPLDSAVGRGMDEKGIKVSVTAIPIPMGCSPAFEGKSIRKEEMYVEFGGGRSPAFELLRVKPAEDVSDGKIQVIGPEIEDMKEGSAMPLAILVDVAGKSMKKDYEPVLERRIHNFLNYGEGSWHVAQRDIIWVRLSAEAVKKGVRVRHLGDLLAAKFRMDFPDLLDAVQVTLITDEEKVRERQKEAERVYEERDQRIRGMKDKDVDTFYSCTLCQTFAPNHVCIITPERPALCGAISWLDGRIAYEIAPAGANQPVKKGMVLDELRGEFEGVNRFVKKASHGEVDRCSLYGVMEYPMTCCGCFECIVLMLPEVNGFMVVNREFKGITPSGMTFSTLAGTIGGGAQTPGFAGISKNYILSEKFLQAEGGIARLVWMPALLREELGSRLKEEFGKRGQEGLFEKIADEKTASTIEELTEFLIRVKHPALDMAPLI